MKFPRPCSLLVSSLALVLPAFGQCEEARLTASDADVLDYFGYVVAISGDVAAVTADKDGKYPVPMPGIVKDSEY